MAKVLAYTSPARGHLFPVVPILSELQARGHDVALRTLASQVETMRGLGVDAQPVDPAIEAIGHDDYLARTPIGSNRRSVRAFCARAVHDAPDLRRAIDAERPDALLVDVNAFGAIAAAEAWGGPWAVWCPYPLPLPSRDAPPFGPGLKPARGPVGRARDAALRPLLLYLTAEPFEYPRGDWPANVRMVGPCAWDPPADPPAWLDESDEPLVLVTTSSEFQDDGRLARTALEALADEPVHVVATLPSARIGPGEVPPNARVLEFVPHAPLLERAACVLTHGGMGATQKALARGVPVCAVPFGRDQLEVARRVEVAGAGSRLPAQRLRADRLRAKAREAIGRRAGAQRVAA